MTDYNYSIATDFTSLDVAGVPNLELLRDEVADSAITTGGTLDDVACAGDTVTFKFSGTLSVGDETILDGIVTAHTGTWPGSAPGEGPLNYYEVSATDSPSTTSATYVDIPSMSISDIQAGKWLALFSTTLTHQDDAGIADVGIAVNGTIATPSERSVTIRHKDINYNFFTQAFLDLSDGDTVAARYKDGTAGGKYTQVFERNLILVRLD